MVQDFIQRILLTAPPVLFALTVHECAHAWVASRLGDPTAKAFGRVSLNPLRHLDPIGTVALFLTGMFGWAKPVPINPMNFKNPSKGLMLTAIAGPLANITLAALSAVVYKLVFVDGDGFFMAMHGVYMPLEIMVKVSIVLNVSLAVFNLIPIPPLDGSRVLSHFLPMQKAFAFARMEPYGFIILMALIMTGVIDKVISPVVYFTAGILTGGVF
ncbi:site-2 protease family protein [bacterium]|nr:MAG: site-2 protease family protein [bacterium]